MLSRTRFSQRPHFADGTEAKLEIHAKSPRCPPLPICQAHLRRKGRRKEDAGSRGSLVCVGESVPRAGKVTVSSQGPRGSCVQGKIGPRSPDGSPGSIRVTPSWQQGPQGKSSGP